MSVTNHPGQARLAQAVSLFNEGRRAEAEALCRDLHRALPDDPPVLQLLAVICQSRSSAAEARPFIERCLALRPGHGPSLMVAAGVWQDLRELAAAQAALEAVLRQQPGFVQAAVNLGIVLLERGDLAAALRRFGQAYRMQPATFGRIAHALCAAPCGALWLDPEALRQALNAAA